MIQSRGSVIRMRCTYTVEMHLLYSRDALTQSRCNYYTVEMHLYSRDVLIIQSRCTYTVDTDEMHLYSRCALTIQSRCIYTVEMYLLYSRDALIRSRCTCTVEMHLPFSPDPLKTLLNGPYVSHNLGQHSKTYNGFSVSSCPEENEELK